MNRLRAALAVAVAAGMGGTNLFDATAPTTRIGRGNRLARANSTSRYLILPMDRSKYKPHQGEKECARRVRQMEMAS